ncbi:uncharacterized protein LOC128228367 isoform X1 [Mya arenaria]|uniref:uncharacterized protein LOC128228367 isoform X1 n=1 Tax=Mya arenaria TaxID=6604 RepID=UPI0022E4EB6F|nr:uncharacterized protein LOC128228367 isoform X1 [Mya arenaria]
MKIGTVCVCFVVCVTLISTCSGEQHRAYEREARRRKKRVGKKVTPPLRSVDRKKEQVEDDPTDLYKSLYGAGAVTGIATGGCSGMQNLLGAMFMSSADLNDMAIHMVDELAPVSDSKGGKKKSRYVVKNRITQSISPFAAVGDSGSCCETVLNVTAPGLVMVDGREMPVVHMNHSYQYLQEGNCVNAGSRCSGTGICTQRYKYAFLLMYDNDLSGKVDPPVRYGRVPVRSHCECMNIGNAG